MNETPGTHGTQGTQGNRTWDAVRRAPTGRASVWKFNWLANHKIIRALEKARVHAHGALLDVGCGSQPFAPLFDGFVTRYYGTDLSSSRYLGGARLDAFARAEALPIRSASVDTVLGLSMLTYLPEPLGMLKEANRVLRPGGVLLLEFTQMAPLHDPPHDYFRFTRHGAAWLLGRAGFEPVEFIPVGGLAARVGLSVIAALNRVNRGPIRVITEIPVRMLYVILQLGFELLDRVFFDPREVLAHLVVAKKK
ncbi:MAG: class I SAM-dependent methyltransferase [Candidatus Eisenbacteria bacterium]|nr:class I SAM-dependent methyltransferase [Candidatus Eisenbacteria bacterium]